MSITLNVNGASYTVDPVEGMPLLWVLRDLLGLTGTKFGCGIGVCGACTVHIDGRPSRACMITTDNLDGAAIVTIEGLAPAGDHPLQRAWLAEKVSQCGYCQAGQLLRAAALLDQNPDPSDAEIDNAMAGIICRCGTYQRIRAAVRRAVEEMSNG